MPEEMPEEMPEDLPKDTPETMSDSIKVLFVNELGGADGHVEPLVRMARLLAPYGVQPIYALADAVSPGALIAEVSAPVLPAPSHPFPLTPKAGQASYGDLLACHGFAARADLRLLVSSWDALFEMINPAFVVASHAPTALLAARGRLPVALVGTGFTMPPASMPLFPALRPDTASLRPQIQVLETVNAVLAERGESPLNRLPELLATQARLLDTIPLLDPYAPLRDEPYLALGASAAPFESLGVHAGVFAALDMGGGQAAATVEVLALLAEGLPVEARLWGPGADAAMRFLARRGALVHERPAPMPETLTRTRLLVSQGGHALSRLAAEAGRPQVILPQTFEAMLHGAALEEAGAAKIAWDGGRDTILDHIHWALAEGGASAVALATRLEPPPLWDGAGFLERFGGGPQRRRSPSSAKPRRRDRGVVVGETTPRAANASTPAAKPAA
jgi:hypothetical protein